MDKNKTLEILKISISSCRKLELMDEALSAIGIDTDRSDMENVKGQLMECAYIILDIAKEDMRSDSVVTIMSDTSLSEDQILERLIESFGEIK